MDKRIKKILILIFVVLFLLAIPATIFYCQGYRFDFKNKKLVKTGGLSFQTRPTNCEVYLDEEIIKKTDLLFGSVFVKNLLPKRYAVRISKEGFSSWEKILEVKEAFVTEAKNIVLFPEKFNFSVILSDVEDYFLSPDGKKIILKKSDEESWNLAIFDLEKNVQENFLSEKDLEEKGLKFLDLNWVFDSRRLLLKTEFQKETKYFIIDVPTEEKTKISPLDYGVIEDVSFNPYNSQEIFFVKILNDDKSLLKINYVEKNNPVMILKNILTYRVYDKDVFWLGLDGFLRKSNFSGETLEIINTKPFLIEENSGYEAEIFPGAVFLKKENVLYQVNSSKTFEVFFESVNNLKISPDYKKLAIVNDYEIWILFLSDALEQPQRKAGQKIFLTRFSQKIDEIFWLNQNYLIFTVGDKIRTSSFHSENLDFSISSKLKIAEIDDRDKINIVDLDEYKNPKIFWNENYKRLYILSENNVYLLTNLLP